jgi:hypothetical protein
MTATLIAISVIFALAYLAAALTLATPRSTR